MRMSPLRWKTRKWLTAAAVAAFAAALPLTACAQVDGPGNGPGPQVSVPATMPAMAPVKIVRTGGFAGVNQTLEIAADGTWVYTDKRAGTSQRGQLTAAQRTELTRLVTDPNFVTQVKQKPGPGTCNDTFMYAFTIGDLSASFDDCGDKSERPAVQAVLSALTSMTAM